MKTSLKFKEKSLRLAASHVELIFLYTTKIRSFFDLSGPWFLVNSGRFSRRNENIKLMSRHKLTERRRPQKVSKYFFRPRLVSSFDSRHKWKVKFISFALFGLRIFCCFLLSSSGTMAINLNLQLHPHISGISSAGHVFAEALCLSTRVF